VVSNIFRSRIGDLSIAGVVPKHIFRSVWISVLTLCGINVEAKCLSGL